VCKELLIPTRILAPRESGNNEAPQTASQVEAALNKAKLQARACKVRQLAALCPQHNDDAELLSYLEMANYNVNEAAKLLRDDAEFWAHSTLGQSLELDTLLALETLG
jgi:hypothetical protein